PLRPDAKGRGSPRALFISTASKQFRADQSAEGADFQRQPDSHRDGTMSAISEPPAGSFRLSMLLSDTRYRSYTFQFIALALLIAAMAFLGANLLNNLAAAGLNISYSFLGQSSGYDINQTPIPYDSQDTHMRAAVVGILNTLIV